MCARRTTMSTEQSHSTIGRTFGIWLGTDRVTRAHRYSQNSHAHWSLKQDLWIVLFSFANTVIRTSYGARRTELMRLKKIIHYHFLLSCATRSVTVWSFKHEYRTDRMSPLTDIKEIRWLRSTFCYKKKKLFTARAKEFYGTKVACCLRRCCCILFAYEVNTTDK